MLTRIHLQVSRVKKIVAVDPDINVCSNNAAFVMTLAAVSIVCVGRGLTVLEI